MKTLFRTRTCNHCHSTDLRIEVRASEYFPNDEVTVITCRTCGNLVYSENKPIEVQ